MNLQNFLGLTLLNVGATPVMNSIPIEDNIQTFGTLLTQLIIVIVAIVKLVRKPKN